MNSELEVNICTPQTVCTERREKELTAVQLTISQVSPNSRFVYSLLVHLSRSKWNLSGKASS